MKPKRLVFDIETDNLLPDMKEVWVVAIKDMDYDFTPVTYTGDSIANALDHLASADEVWGHNIVDFDLRALRKRFPRWPGVRKDRVYDSLLGSQLAFPDIQTWDHAQFVHDGMPKDLAGSYSIEAWGWRLGEHKVGLDVSFDRLSPELVDRCVGDCVVNSLLVGRLGGMLPARAWDTERRLAWYLKDQEDNGFPFRVDDAIALAGKLRAVQARKHEELVAWGGTWVKPGEIWTPKKDDRRRGYVAGAEMQRIEIVTFNPGSDQHVAKRLQDLYGWVPEAFTDGGQPQVNEAVLTPLSEAIDDNGDFRYPLVGALMEYSDIDKKLGYLMDGKEAWLKHARKDGPGGIDVIHGRVNQLGAATGRASHYAPNLGQVPKDKYLNGVVVPNKTPGARGIFRDLFYVPDGWVLVGTDMSGIELRMLGHYMSYHDGGEFAKIILEGDIHQVNADTWRVTRDDDKQGSSKRGIYALIYGAGDPKLGRTLYPATVGEDAQRAAGRRARAAIMGRFPGLESLTDDVKSKGRLRGYLLGLDGRRLPMRSEHSALNTVLQSAGAVSSKFWINNVHDRLTADLGPQGWDGKWAGMVWVHDELQIAVRVGYEQQVAQAMVWGIEEAGRQLNLNVPITGKSSFGHTWGDTH